MEKFINYEMCKKCGGVCCKENGCIYLPQDFNNLDFESLKRVLDEGNVSISGQPIQFYGNAWTFLLYLRARNQNADIVDLITSGGPCKLLTSTGCSLGENDRPSLGLAIKPVAVGGPCSKTFSQDQVVDAWMDHSEVLSNLVQHYTDKDVISVIVEQMTNQMDRIKKLEELKNMEKLIKYWYYNIIVNRPYYTPEEVKKMVLF